MKLKIYNINIKKEKKKAIMGIGDWGLGMGEKS